MYIHRPALSNLSALFSLSSQNFLFPVILPSQECKPLQADILLWLYLEHLKHAINILEI